MPVSELKLIKRCREFCDMEQEVQKDLEEVER